MRCFRAPGHPLPAETLLARALPGLAPARRRALLREGRLRRARPGPRGPRDAGPVAARGTVAPGTLLLLDGPEPAPEELGAAADAVDAADEPGAAPEVARRWQGLAPVPPWPEAWRRLDGGGRVHLRREQVARGLAAVQVALEGAARGEDARRLAADLGTPFLGDTRHGGILVEGGLRLRPAQEAGAPEWPAEPVFPPDATSPDLREGTLAVSAATARALRRGHPWVRPDAGTGDPGRHPPGAFVRLVPPRGAPLGLALVEGPGPVAARLWAREARRPREAPSVEARVHAALGRRGALLRAAREGRTDAFRLVHGEADGLPGVAVDRLGPLLRVLTTSRAAAPHVPRVVDALLRQLGEAPAVVEGVHLRPAPPRVRLRAVHGLRGTPPPEPLRVREEGLVFRVESGLAEPERPRPGVGLFLDQRANRALVCARTRPGARILNLFAHTGAFSVALLAAGAGEVVSVDLSAPYLARLEAHLADNGLAGAGRHRAVRMDARRFVETLPPGARFDGIVLDPPTAAAAGRRFWSAQRELPGLVRAALAHLAPEGWLLLSRNEQRGRGDLGRLVRDAAAAAARPLAAIEEAPPGEDFPRLAGFPEGDPFEAVLATARP